MSLPSPLSRRKPIIPAMVVAIALLLAATISQTVESAGNFVRPRDVTTPTKGKGNTQGPQEQTAKARRFPNLDIRVTEPDTMSAIATANASNITQRLQARKTAVDQGLNRLRNFSRGVQAKSSPVTGAVEVLRSTTGALSGPALGRNAQDIVRGFITANSDIYGLSSKEIASLKFHGESVSGSGMR